MPDYLVAVDVGASKTLLALAFPGPGGWTWLTQPWRFPTPREPAAAADLISRSVNEIASIPGTPRAVGLAIPGPVDSRQGIVSHLPNLGWHDVPFAAMLAERLVAPVALDDDARLGALGEWSAGAGQGAHGLAYVTVSTGIGCGLVLDGRLWAGGHGLAGEFGHIVVNPGGPRCGCGHRGCVEAYAGGLALARAARKAWPRVRLGDGTPSPRSAAEIFRLAGAGDQIAAGIIDQAAEALAIGLAAIAAIFDPELIVIGGSIALSQRTWLRSVVSRSRKRCIVQTGASMRVVSPALANRSALTGAAEMAWRAMTQANRADAIGREDLACGGARTMPVAVTWSLDGPLVLVEEAAKDGSAPDSFLGEIGYGVVGPRWLELEGAVRSSPVVVPCIFAHHAAQASFAED